METREYIRALKSLVADFIRDKQPEDVSYYQEVYDWLDSLPVTSFQQEQQMPDSTQLIAEWEKEKAVLEQKDFRGDAERMAYNAFLDGFVKGLGLNARKEE